MKNNNITDEELRDEYKQYVSYKTERKEPYISWYQYKKDRLKDLEKFGTQYIEDKFRHELGRMR